jgi:hypothetical protein
LSKDAIYLRGFKRVLELLVEGIDLTPFWLGKISENHLPVVSELTERGMLRAPLAYPEFLSRPAAIKRIERSRGSGSFANLIRSSMPC